MAVMMKLYPEFVLVYGEWEKPQKIDSIKTNVHKFILLEYNEVVQQVSYLCLSTVNAFTSIS